jgi:hypothetical protein
MEPDEIDVTPLAWRIGNHSLVERATGEMKSSQ